MKKEKNMEVRQVVEVPIEQIKQITNARAEYREQELVELMTSMRQTGLLQPIGLKAVSGNEFEVVFGNRRFVAAKKLGWVTISAIMTGAELEDDFLIKNATENLVRSNVTLSEQGRIFDRLNQLGLTPSEISARLGISQTNVESGLETYRRIPKKFHNKIVTGTLMRGQAKKGRLSMATASRILNTVRTYDISKEQADVLYEYAMQDKVTSGTVLSVGKLISQGYKIEDAIQRSEELSTLTISVVLTKKEINRIEGTYNTSVSRFLAEILKADTRIKLLKAGNITINDRSIVRKKMK